MSEPGVRRETPITLETRVRPSPDTLYRNLDGEAVLLGLRTAGYYGLDPVGTRIFELIDEKGLLSDVLRVVVDEFDVEAARAEHDLLALTAALVEKGLVDVIEAAPDATP